MCIALFSTAHPKYALIVASNRDEYLHRPTAPAAWWEDPHGHVLAGRDLQRSVRGTWLGVTRDGRIAVLTNYREDEEVRGSVSRGAMVNAYLTEQQAGSVEDTESFARRLVTGGAARGSGGFTLVCGRMGSPLAVVSNRMAKLDEVEWIARGAGTATAAGGGGGEGDGGQGQQQQPAAAVAAATTLGLSNAAFGNREWPKVLEGEELLGKIIEGNVRYGHDEADMVRKIFVLLSRDTLPKRQEGEEWSSYINELKNSVFIPVTGGDDSGLRGDEIATARSRRRMSVNKMAPGAYGTTKQSLVLVTHDGRVTFIEKTLYEDGVSVLDDSSATRTFEYTISS